MVLRALSQSIVGLDIGSLSKIYRETGDLGDTASKIIQAKENNKKQGTLFPSKKMMMTVDRVYLTLARLLCLLVMMVQLDFLQLQFYLPPVLYLSLLLTFIIDSHNHL
jgi:hypothetical protein